MQLDAFKTNGSSPPEFATAPPTEESSVSHTSRESACETSKVSRGKVVKRTWKWRGHKRVAYIFDVMIHGRRVRRQYATRAEAEEALDAFKDEARKPKRESPPPVLTLEAALSRFLELKARKRTAKQYERIAEHLKSHFGGQTPLDQLTAERISSYKAMRLATKRHGRTLSPAAVNRPLALLRHLLRLARRWKVLAEVPEIDLEREPQGRLRWLTPEDAQRLLAACKESRNPVLADLVEFALFTGLRQGEALNLTWDDVDRARGVIRLEITKSGYRREVPLSGAADAVLARRLTNDRKTYVFGSQKRDTFRTAWEAAVKRAKIDDFRFHDLRHTFASWLIQRGRSLKEVQEALGHRTIAMTMRYSHLGPDHLRAAVAVLDNVLPAAPLTMAQERHMDEEPAAGTAGSPKQPSTTSGS
jgi:integrase